jgi:galactokinase
MTNKKTANTTKADVKYSYYSKLLCEPFDTIEELQEAEEAYYAKQKAKEDAAAQKKADAQKVDEAFKALNAARKVYKEDLTQLTKEYAESLENLKKAFELGKKDITNRLAEADEAYQAALNEFTSKYDQYHLTLKDGDYETTIEKQTSGEANNYGIFDILESIFN